MGNFMENLSDRMNTSITTNGAKGYKTTGNLLLDFNFSIATLRGEEPEKIIEKWIPLYEEYKYNNETSVALKYLFWIRDIREGLGERKIFRVIMKYLCKHDPNSIIHTLIFIPTFGRWDDLIYLLDKDTNKLIYDYIISLLKNQIMEDYNTATMKSPINNEKYNINQISLLAKWMPSVNTSSERTVEKAKEISKAFGWSYKRYRKTMSRLRKYIGIVEEKMSSNKWEEIQYENVPSKANLLYSRTFMKHDEERRLQYISDLQNGKTTINSSILFPHDIVHKLNNEPSSADVFESMWKALPNLVDENSRTIVVGDGSCSMTTRINRSTTVTSEEVCIGLCLYFAERLKGEFHNKYITFSEHPELVNLLDSTRFVDKVAICRKYNEIANTNIEAVFRLILNVAVEYNMKQDEIPDNILIISDMEFDGCAVMDGSVVNNKLMDTAKTMFKVHGYKLPRIIFWRVNGCTNTIPMVQNDLGVILVSGFSLNIVKMVMSSKTDPYECLLEQILSGRYKCIGNELKIIKDCIFKGNIITYTKKR